MNKNLSLVVLSILALLPGCQGGETVAPLPNYTIEQFLDTVQVSGSSFSADGQRILFSTNQSGIFNASSVPVTGGEPTQITDSSEESMYAVSFFPEDDRVLLRADQGGNELNHLFLREEDGSIRDLTPWENSVNSFAGWSHDLERFFVSSNRRDPRAFDTDEVSLTTLEPRMIFQNDQGYFPGSISPDGRYLSLVKVTTSANTDIYLYDFTDKSTRHLTPHKGDVVHTPSAFSTDSRQLHFLTDEGSEFTYVKSLDLESGQASKVFETNWDVMYSIFSHAGKYRVVGVNEDARTVISVIDTSSGEPVALPEFPVGEITSVNISRDESRMAFYMNGSTSPNNLYVYDFGTGEYTQLTDTLNREMDATHLVEAQTIRYPSYDDLEIPAVYYQPKQASSDHKVPGLVWVHGGPGGQSRVGYQALMQYLVNQGYAVLAVNNRGSSGYGKTFFHLDDLKHGEDDLQDCIEGKKFLESTGVVDPDKIGIIGGSYGGYMVLAALAFEPTAFNVGVDIFGVANWVRTLKSIPPWWTAQKDALYGEMGNPATDEEYLRRISPLFHASNIVRPLLVTQGANDPRVLKIESDEMVAAVQQNGVPVEYVVFDDEGHGFRKKENELKAWKSILDFLDKHLKGQAGAAATTED